MDPDRLIYKLGRNVYDGLIDLNNGNTVRVNHTPDIVRYLRNRPVHLKDALEFIAAKICELNSCISVTIRYVMSPVSNDTLRY